MAGRTLKTAVALLAIPFLAAATACSTGQPATTPALETPTAPVATTSTAAPTPAQPVTPTAAPTTPTTPPTATDPSPAAPPGTSVSVVDPTDLANKVLALDQRVPGDINLFASKFEWGEAVAYPITGSPMTPADGPALSESEVRAQLVPFLEALSNGEPNQVSHAMALFDSEEAIAMIPDHNLRAAFISILVTAGAPTVDYFLNSNEFAYIEYGRPAYPNALAQAVSRFFPDSGNRQVITINDRYINEDFAYLIGLITHEILHHDIGNNPNEEVVNNAITSIVHMQVLLAHPELAYGGTEFARVMNTRVLGLINSRHPGSGDIALLVEDGKGIFTDGRAARDYFKWWNGLENIRPTPAPEPLRQILEGILEEGTPIPEELVFDVNTIRLFDHLNDEWMSDVNRLRISVLLQLVSVEEIAAEGGITQEQVIEMFDLQPMLDVMIAAPSPP